MVALAGSSQHIPGLDIPSVHLEELTFSRKAFPEGNHQYLKLQTALIGNEFSKCNILKMSGQVHQWSVQLRSLMTVASRESSSDHMVVTLCVLDLQLFGHILNIP